MSLNADEIARLPDSQLLTYFRKYAAVSVQAAPKFKYRIRLGQTRCIYAPTPELLQTRFIAAVHQHRFTPGFVQSPPLKTIKAAETKTVTPPTTPQKPTTVESPTVSPLDFATGKAAEPTPDHSAPDVPPESIRWG